MAQNLNIILLNFCHLNLMFDKQYIRLKLYYRWSLVLSILAISYYEVYFHFGNFHEPLFKGVAFYLRLSIVIYFSIILIILKTIPKNIFKIIGFLIVISLSWMASLLDFLTIGYQAISVTDFIFIILGSSVIFDFSLISYIIALILITSFHFILLSFYPNLPSTDLVNHIFLIGLSCLIGIPINYLINSIKNNEQRALQEREMLLREIHHRVKNNLQTISSLLNLQVKNLSDNVSKTIVLESQSRVKSMAYIHTLLYESDSLCNIDFTKYLNQLLMSLQHSFGDPSKAINFNIDANNINVNIDQAVPLGLITNELVTNSFKYAFTNSVNGKISLELKHIKKQTLQYKISDNGIGLTNDFNVDKCETLGLKLVKLLTAQIDGNLKIINENGLTYIITFNDYIK